MFDLLRLHDMYLKGTTTKADLNLNTSKMPILILQRQQRYLKSDFHFEEMLT